MKIYKSKDTNITKYVHDNGAETAIKVVSSCNNDIDESTNTIITNEIDKEKFSVFVSSSSGCPLKCKFCYLTLNEQPYTKLTEDQIFNNFKEALHNKILEEPTLRKRYIKLSWMGMGDAFLRDPYDVRQTSLRMLRYAIGDLGIYGIDGVDISTIMPSCRGWQHQLGSLDDDLRRYKMNPNNPVNRSRVRLFYSLISSWNREIIIPSGNNVINDLYSLRIFRDWYNIDVILHSLILKNINDKLTDVESMDITLHNYLPNAEFRILRYNKHDKSEYTEPENFIEIAKEYKKRLGKVKIQTSKGEDVKASCGMFICKEE